MDKLKLEKYVDDKIKYDKKIRYLDYEIVENSVKLEDIINEKAKNANYAIKIEELSQSIKKAEEEKEKITLQSINDFKEIRKILIKEIDEKINSGDYFIEKLCSIKGYLNQINSIYFNIEEFSNTVTQIDNFKMQNKKEVNYESGKISEWFVQKQSKTQSFDIKEQRVIDFENLLKYMYKISKDYRIKVEENINKYIDNYDIIEKSEIMQNEFEKIKSDFVFKFNETIAKFEKDENVNELDKKIQNVLENNKQIERKNTLLLEESCILKNKVEKLQEVYFVHGYATKILTKFLELEVIKDSNNNIQIKHKDDVFEKVRKITHDERIKHIIDVSKWTKNMENKLRYYKIKENDFQYILLLIRQTEDTCNMNYEKITNSIIKLCDCYINLEEIEINNKVKKQKLEENKNIAEILRKGINNISKKYSKIPFIGRKVAYILNNKALNA